jgi:acetyltransferase-like isoleucine patch superfamily enzyme
MSIFRRVAGWTALGGYRLVRRTYAKAFSLAVGGAFAEFGARSVIEPPVRIGGEQRIAIGSDVYVGAGSWLQSLAHEPGPPVVEIGSGTSIAGGCVLSAAQSVRLEERVLVARNVYISDHIHAYEDVGHAVLDQGLARIVPVLVCSGAWLGENVVVCPGVTIGRGAVVGANSVVLQDVPDYALAVGAPARVVKRFGTTSLELAR